MSMPAIMDKKNIRLVLGQVTKEIEFISDAKVRRIQTTLLNLVESLANDIEQAQNSIQQLKDENNRLKGEQGKPNIRKQKNDDTDNSNHSSENERKTAKKSKKKKPKKKDAIKIDRKLVCKIDKDNLPDDIQFKGYETKVIQDIEIKTDNIKFLREVYYSPSLKKTFIADYPDGYDGDFGPGIKSIILSAYHDSKMTQPAIKRFFDTWNIQISKATISRILTDNHDTFHQEKKAIIIAGVLSTPYQHFDDTSARVNGKNYYTHVLCNPFYTAFFTMPHKDRITVLEVLYPEGLKFTFNQDSFSLMTELGLPNKHLSAIRDITAPTIMTKAEVNVLLDKLFPSSRKNKQKKNRKIILEATAIIFYQTSKYAINFLLCDDAPQFNKITKYKALCWVHEGRHYKKLTPIVPEHQKALDEFIALFWDFYRKLLDYKKEISSTKKEKLSESLSKEFDELFSTITGYDELDDRIHKTFSKKDMLMLVLKFSFLPLHNNPAELGARYQARHRDINLQTRNQKGTSAKDTFATIVQTARKLKVNFFDYMKDRITKVFKMDSLASLIEKNSKFEFDST